MLKTSKFCRTASILGILAAICFVLNVYSLKHPFYAAKGDNIQRRFLENFIQGDGEDEVKRDVLFGLYNDLPPEKLIQYRKIVKKFISRDGIGSLLDKDTEEIPMSYTLLVNRF